MEWFHSTDREQERPNGGLASSHEIQSAFDEQREYLYWIALLITGDEALANQAVVNASALSANYSSVFRDWLNGWAKHATVRAAVREVRDLISTSAAYFAVDCRLRTRAGRTRRIVAVAYCQALRWNAERTNPQWVPNEDRTDSRF